MTLLAILVGGFVFIIAQYLHDTIQEEKHMQKRIEKIFFGSYDSSVSNRSKNKAGDLFRKSKNDGLTPLKLKKASAGLLVAGALAYLLFPNAGLPILAVASIPVVMVFAVSLKIKKARSRIQTELPGALDLMVICLTAGLGINAAFERVSNEMQDSPLGEEFRRLVNEANSGMPLEEALRAMAARVTIPEINSIVGPVIQAHKSGASISETFQIQALSLREKMRLQTKEKMMRVPILVMLPVVLFIIPVVFTIILSPIVIQLMAPSAQA